MATCNALHFRLKIRPCAFSRTAEGWRGVRCSKMARSAAQQCLGAQWQPCPSHTRATPATSWQHLQPWRSYTIYTILYTILWFLICVAMPCAPALHAVIQQIEMEIATSFQEMGEIALTWPPGWNVECAHGVSKAQGVYKALQCKTLCKDVLSLYWNIAQTPRLGILWWIMAQPILHGKWKAFFRTASMN